MKTYPSCTRTGTASLSSRCCPVTTVSFLCLISCSLVRLWSRTSRSTLISALTVWLTTTSNSAIPSSTYGKPNIFSRAVILALQYARLCQVNFPWQVYICIFVSPVMWFCQTLKMSTSHSDTSGSPPPTVTLVGVHPHSDTSGSPPPQWH